MKKSSQVLLRSCLLTGFTALVFAVPALADKNNGTPSGGNPGINNAAHRTAAGCSPSKAQTDLDVNNVRTRILGGGDMWWDLDRQRYEVPKNSGLNSLFSGALWIGGIDAGGQLKVAAMTYRQTGNDFFPGPVSIGSTSISEDECLKYDKHWKISRSEVQDFVDNFGAGNTIPNSILTWPGNGNSEQTQFLAPFNDVNGDGVYDPAGSGDYPNYDLNGKASCKSCGNADYKDLLFGDQTLWWVFNDVGNIHSETGAEPIGLEIQAQAFGFTTNDEINNMTFYQYKIINRSTYQVNDTYFGQWVDSDLGNAYDDYVGCDVERGLGYAYNGDPFDETTSSQNGYGTHPPSIGVDFFQGPLADPGDGVDNNKNCTIDEPCEEIIMSKFVYYNNDFTIRGNPVTGSHFYNYLRGMWKDGSHMTYGGSGYQTGVDCEFMFPGNTDHSYEWGTGGTCASPGAAQPDWDEVAAGNMPSDRRFLQSAGKFTLTPGAVNYITTGVVWARANSGDNFASVNLMKLADDKAQALFNNCFKVLNGPDAPDMAIRELDKQVILSLTNKTTSNNAGEKYEEIDPLINQEITYSYIDAAGIAQDTTISVDNKFRFQGYQVYQLKDKTVSITDIQDADKARLIFQCDIKDGVSHLVNFVFDPTVSATVPIDEVTGADAGISHTISINKDLFAPGNNVLVNHKTYYYTVISYAYNQYKEYRENTPADPFLPYAASSDGQRKPYFAGRRNIKTYTAIPHNPMVENQGQILHAKYGDMPIITRQEGKGNGGMALDFSDATITEILSSSSNRALFPVYKKGAGPVNIKVYDPVAVPKGDFSLRFSAAASRPSAMDSATWVLKNETTGESVSSEQMIMFNNEQLIPAWGLSLSIKQGYGPGPLGGDLLGNNGYIKDTTEIADITKAWLQGVPDIDGNGDFNWIRSGTYSVSTPTTLDNDYYTEAYAPYVGYDPNQIYEKIGVGNAALMAGGTWAPYRLCAFERSEGTPPVSVLSGPAAKDAKVFKTSPILNESENPLIAANRMKDLQSVDIVFTPDKSLWTRSAVVESGYEKALAIGKAQKLSPRLSPSIGKDGQVDGSGTGMGWFPGYAVSLETGERLNIIYAEDSWQVGENGADMIWNPTSTVFTRAETPFGGRHYVYIMNSRYDECADYKAKLDAADYTSVWKQAGWVTIPLIASAYVVKAGVMFVPPTETKVKIRVSKQYATYKTADSPVNADMPYYTFNSNDLFNDKGNATAAKVALDKMNVVPNPYYAYSSYEQNGLDNVVKITNLPSKCTISIFTISGILIRKFERSVANDLSEGATLDKLSTETTQDWDLKNNSGTPVSSGVYLIHIKVDGVGERVIKWFGVMRPVDLDTY